ncbi:MAG: dipicolinate synthase subunit DpsA [Ruminococcaceae bacterium]|nr:dipicolinate synthase subunit DpsA [Oscillospiraceae bacterium]
MNGKKMLILGGDRRFVTLADRFVQDGGQVAVYGFSPEVEFDTQVERASDLASAVAGKDLVITGLPATNDDMTLRTPLYDGKVYLYELFRLMKPSQLLLGGKITKKMWGLGKIYSVSMADYLEREEMAVLNAIPTAEGALEIALRELPVTLHGAQVMVLGFGRIGKVLAHMLWGLGAKVCVEARKHEDLSWIRAYGYRGVHLSQLSEVAGGMQVIFNTVPHPVIDQRVISGLSRDCLIIDLASAPGGVDAQKAAAAGIRVIPALSLPGKVAPVTAGEIIADTIRNIILDLEV